MKRNYGIDLLRMSAMGFVVVLHLVGIGGICAEAPLLSCNFLVSQFLRTATYCAVNVYALISGFVGWNRRAKPSGLLTLWLKVICICVGSTLLAEVLMPDRVGWANLKSAFTPVKNGTFWYFSAYVGLFCFMNVLNHAVRSISAREALLAVISLSLVVASLPFSNIHTTFQVAVGYNTLWLMILYLCGGLLARFEIPQRAKKRHWAMLYLLAVLASLVPRLVLLWQKPELWTPANQNLWVQYTSPSIILSSVALVCLFSRLELKESAVRIVKKLSPHCFGVYLLHTHPLFFDNVIGGRFAWLGTAPLWELLGVLLGAVAVIYAAGTALDFLVTKAVHLLGVHRLLKKLDRPFEP